MTSAERGGRTIVLLPTYNEAGNLARMLARIREYLPQADILVIDDASPDGTGEIADAAARKDPSVQVAHRPGKLGLGVAYRYGYRRALDGGYARILQMDCDFSHDPRDLPRLHRLLGRYPAVIGSRRVHGGGSDGWPLYRDALSSAGSLYARAILSSPVKDLTSGFKAFRSEALGALPLDRLRSDGYGFQIEVTAFLVALGFEVHEAPIRFVDRKWGRSKMSSRIVAEALLNVWSIRRAAKGLVR